MELLSEMCQKVHLNMNKIFDILIEIAVLHDVYSCESFVNFLIYVKSRNRNLTLNFTTENYNHSNAS